MSDSKKTKADQHLQRLKNHPVIAIIVVVAIAVIAFAQFTGALSEVGDFFSKFVTRKQAISIQYLVKNGSDKPEEIQRLSDFHITMTQVGSAWIYEQPDGRLLLEVADDLSSLPDYQIPAHGYRKYNAEFPIATYADLLERGGADIHFVLQPENNSSIYSITVPFHRSAVKNLSLEFTLKAINNNSDLRFQKLIVSNRTNPELEKKCQQEALTFPLQEFSNFIHNDQNSKIIIDSKNYLKNVFALQAFCGHVVGQFINCDILAIASHPHGLILFERDSHTISQTYRDGIISQIVFELKQNPHLNVILIGRASDIGHNDYTDQLSALRAKSVCKVLTEKGISFSRVSTLWLGSHPPQIDDFIATEYGLKDLYDKIGKDMINCSVMAVLF